MPNEHRSLVIKEKRVVLRDVHRHMSVLPFSLPLAYSPSLFFNNAHGGRDSFTTIARSEEAEIQRFTHSNPLLHTIIENLINQVLGKGFSFIFADPLNTNRSTDVFQMHIIDGLWLPEVRKAIGQVIAYGYYTVQYTQITKKHNVPAEFIGDFYPNVLNKEYYHMAWTTSADRSRNYFALDVSALGATPGLYTTSYDKRIPNTRTYVIYEPTVEGHVQSPVQKILPQLKRLLALWSNMTDADVRRSFPLKVVTTGASSSGRGGGGVGGARRSGTSASGLQHYQISENDSALADEYIEQQHNAATYFALQDQISVYGRANPESIIDEIDPQSGRRHERLLPNPYQNSFVLPYGCNMSTGPMPEVMGDFDAKIELLLSEVSTTMGLAVEMIHQRTTGARFASDERIALRNMATTISKHQEWISRDLRTMHLDIYAKSYKRAFKRQLTNARTQSYRKGNTNVFDKLKDSRFLSQLQNGYKLTVQFYTHPIVSLKDLLELRDNGVISQATYSEEALKQFGMSPDLVPTDAQIKADLKRKKEHYTALGIPDDEAAYMVVSETTGMQFTKEKPPPAPKVTKQAKPKKKAKVKESPASSSSTTSTTKEESKKTETKEPGTEEKGKEKSSNVEGQEKTTTAKKKKKKKKKKTKD